MSSFATYGASSMSAESGRARLPAPARSDPSRIFEIFRNELGRWQAASADGMVLGIFFKCQDAIRFARHECDDRASLTLIVHDGEALSPAARKAA
jgi:hypothetical protein